MKKRYALLLTTVFSMAATCNVMAAGEASGEWYGNMYGMPITLTLEESGEYSMDFDGDPQTGSWEVDGETLYMDKGTDEELTFDYDGETLYAEMDGIEFVFSRDAEAALGFVPAEARTDSTIEEFAGHWTATQVSTMGLVAPLELMEVDKVELEIADTKLDFIMAGGDTFGEWEIPDLECELADGALTFVMEAEDEYPEDTIWTVQLLEDGTMSLSTDMTEEDQLIFYLEAGEAAEEETEAAE